MEAKSVQLLKFLNKPSQFEIPIYQRLYSWKEEQCKQLLDDIVLAGANDDIKSHFFGSVIYIQKSLHQRSNEPPDLVIDGQQRLTTMSILLEVLARKIKDTEAKGLTSEKIRTNYLKNDRKYKLVLTKTDKTSLNELIDGKEFSKGHSIRIKENFEFFTKQLEEKNHEDLEHIVMGMEKLFIIDVSLDSKCDNPQLIFESMNAKGMHLSKIDLIRNFLLIGLASEKQDEIYKEYWKPMENLFGQENIRQYFDRFVRDYLTIKINTFPTFKTIYKEFKKFQSKHYPLKNNVTDLLSDLKKFAKYYTNIFLDKEEEPKLKQAFKNLVELEAKVSAPFLIQVYDDYNQKLLSLNEFVEIVQLTESYILRRKIVEIPTASLNKTFAKFHKNIEKENYLDSIKLAYQNLETYKRFPTDEEFKESIENKDDNNRSISYFLRRLENFDRKEKISPKDYTLEHIMPQTLTKEWKMMLGENCKQVHKEYLNNVGNLTLTGYNSEYSNKSFQEKKEEIHGGFNKSPLYLNSSVKDREVWNKEAILDRAKELSKTALKIWKSPNASEEYREKKLLMMASEFSKEDLERILNKNISKAQ